MKVPSPIIQEKQTPQTAIFAGSVWPWLCKKTLPAKIPPMILRGCS
jgi:hypothetical protein